MLDEHKAHQTDHRHQSILLSETLCTNIQNLDLIHGPQKAQRAYRISLFESLESLENTLAHTSILQAGDTPAFTSSAIIVIIGDEILSGKVPDQNAQFLCQELFLLGWRVVKASPLKLESQLRIFRLGDTLKYLQNYCCGGLCRK